MLKLFPREGGEVAISLIRAEPLIISLLTVFSISVVANLIASPLNFPYETENRLVVAVTIPPQAEFVERIGGKYVQVIIMVPPGASPHTYEPTPLQLVQVSKAKIYFEVGSGVDFELSFIPKILEVNPNLIIVNCSEGIRIIDRDPHVWLCPKNAKIMVRNICKALIEADPERKEFYVRNMHNYIKELDDLDVKIRKILNNLAERSFLVYHPAWRYFAEEYNLTQIPVEKVGKAPTAKGIIALIKQAMSLQKKIIFVSPQFDWKKAEAIAESIHGKIVFIDPLARNYVENLLSVALKLAGGNQKDG
ncbi:zinc ABC transporter substrate-binding protein [Candidatus Bathyarchaeota archaeon]|nr:MAG: zinc ABC transporter substrate-binding protein [Candidatus Bathyarchaeota archaeon]